MKQALRATIVRALARLPGRVQYFLSGQPPIVVDGQVLDPMIQLLCRLRRIEKTPGLVEPDYLTGRRRFRSELLALAGPKVKVGRVRDLTIDGAAGPLRARHYVPPVENGARPLLVYLHGGGFVIGDLDVFDEESRLLCAHAGQHVLSVAYRLAPEHPFPAALEDAQASLRWAREHASALGADPSRITIGGDSAGANLAAVVSRLEARAGTPPWAQLLIYPPTDSVIPRRSEELFGEGYFLSTADRDEFGRLYVLGTTVAEDDPRVSPLFAPDLGGLPPALVVAAGFDMLRDEGEAYAEALRAARTPVRLLREPSLPHGFVNMIGFVPAAKAAVIRIASAWRELVEGSA